MLEGKTAIVTGGSKGIGRAIAERYVEEGADVVVANRNAEEGRATADDLGCTFVRCDVSDYDAVRALVDAAVEEFGALDVMVNNAGVGGVAPLADISVEDWDRTLSVDLDGVMYGSKAALPHLMETDGCIVNVASIYGLVGGPGAPAYSAAKGAVVNFTRQVAVDYASEGVRANSLCPGFVETDMTDEYLEQDQFYQFVRGQTPIGRVAEPEEVAGAAAFLASGDASYVTGAAIPVDGGWTAH
jgi:NAD(P)-dependent dehydrogenase (short-subunit alcohol dehydrogenase family)